MEGFPTLNGSWPSPSIGSYCIPSCITHRTLPTYQISLKSKKPFVNGRTDVLPDGHLRPTLLGRLRRVRPKNDPLASSFHHPPHDSWWRGAAPPVSSMMSVPGLIVPQCIMLCWWTAGPTVQLADIPAPKSGPIPHSSPHAAHPVEEGWVGLSK